MVFIKKQSTLKLSKSGLFFVTIFGNFQVILTKNKIIKQVINNAYKFQSVAIKSFIFIRYE
jgi:hypothetical protein